MNQYQPKTPRAAAALAALALSVATMAVMVAAPAAVQGDASVLASRKPAIEVTITPARIDVIATREHPVVLSQLSTPHVNDGV